MTDWTPASRERVEALLARAVEALHPAHKKLFAAMRVPLRSVPVGTHPGETVFVVAEHEGRVLYYSDIEDGWELDRPDASGGIQDRGANQYALSDLMWQLFGSPDDLR